LSTTDVIRNAELGDIVAMLQDQRSRRLDVAVPATDMHSEGGRIRVSGLPSDLTEDGFFDVNGLYTPTVVADEGLSIKLDIPRQYLRRLREQHIELFDANVNGWLDKNKDKSYLLRMFRDDGADNEGRGVLRALLSNRYKSIDNLEAVLAALEGIKNAGIDPFSLSFHGDLTDRRMYLRIESDQVVARAEKLLTNYRSPFGGQLGRDNPVINGGFVLTNSEVGNGRFTLTPRFTVQVCTNGMTVERDAFRATHLGAELGDGVIDWSLEVERKNNDLIIAQTTDSVRKFLDPAYVQAQVDLIEGKAEKPVQAEIIKNVSKSMGFTKDQEENILGMFIKGSDMTAGGVMQAVTAVAVNEPDGDVAAELESKALDVLELAAR